MIGVVDPRMTKRELEVLLRQRRALKAQGKDTRELDEIINHGKQIRTMVRPLFATYCTPDYKPAALEWQASVMAYGFETYILEMPSIGSWRANTRQKPTAILRVREKFQDRAIVFCDADSFLVRYPEIFDGCRLGDVGVYFLGNEFLSGTMYWGPSGRATRLLVAWESLVPLHTKTVCGEQSAFVEAFNCHKKDLIVTYLPEGYCRIFDNKEQRKDPVILHLMHSRRHDVQKEF